MSLKYKISINPSLTLTKTLLLNFSAKSFEIFSISNEIVVSDSTFTRLNSILKSLNIKVEEVYYREISKFGGLFRCSTLPINRSD